MRIPAVMMRGGTSRGLFFHERDLPADPVERERVILHAYGSPDHYRLQVDGIGGATSNTSKVAIIGASDDPEIDVRYTFGQVSIDRSLIDWAGNCGNMSAAVGPFAVDEKLVAPRSPATVVRFLNTNTGKVIIAHVPTTADGRFDPVGDLTIPGVPRPGAAVQLDYLNPGGAVTGSLLPTGSPCDIVHTAEDTVTVSIVDAANPLAFVRFRDVGLAGSETAAEINADEHMLARLAAIRAEAGVLAGIGRSADDVLMNFPSVPKLALVGEPLDYPASDGTTRQSSDYDVRITMLSMGPVHTSIALTGSICIAVAAKVPGTLVHDAAGGPTGPDVTRIGHPAGLLAVAADPILENGQWQVDRVAMFRTARRLFEGAVFALEGDVATSAPSGRTAVAAAPI